MQNYGWGGSVCPRCQGNCAERIDYAPFGAQLSRNGQPCYTSSTSGLPLFTGQIRDGESTAGTDTGLDYFNARYFWATLGRFTSPDIHLIDQHPSDPQSWNLYAYVRNNPLVLIDPTGLGCVYANSSGNGVDSINNDIGSNECASTGGTWVPGTINQNSAVYNGRTGLFQVGSNDGTNVYYATFGAGTTTAEDGSCVNGCTGAQIASANASWLESQLVANSVPGGLDGYMQFLAGRIQPLSGGLLNQIASGPLDFSQNRWAGPGGMGPPGGRGDWAASVHDYNYSTNGPITIGSYFNPALSASTAKALIQSNNKLIRNAGGVQGAKMGLVFGVVNAFQWYANSWKK